MSQKKEVIYIAVSADRLELTLCAFDTVKELAYWADKPIETIKKAIKRHNKDCENDCYYMKIVIPPDDEILKFNIEIKIFYDF